MMADAPMCSNCGHLLVRYGTDAYRCLNCGETMGTQTFGFAKEDTMIHALDGMTIRAKKNEILKKLRDNRETHAEIVKEARTGFVAKAREALQHRLDQLESGKLISLHFELTPPQDYTEVYDTAIAMLELDQNEDMSLTSRQVRNLMMDEWDWKEHFLMANALYSASAAASL